MIRNNKGYQSWLIPMLKKQEGTDQEVEVGIAALEVLGSAGELSVRIKGLESWRDCVEAGSCYRSWLAANTRVGPAYVDLGRLKTVSDGVGVGNYNLNLGDVGGTGRSIEEFNYLVITVQSPDDRWPSAEQVVKGSFKPGKVYEEPKFGPIGGPMEQIGFQPYQQFEPFKPGLPNHKWWKILEPGDC